MGDFNIDMMKIDSDTFFDNFIIKSFCIFYPSCQDYSQVVNINT